MNTLLPASISTIEEAKKLLSDLHSNGESFHPEDDANDIIWDLPEDQKPTVEECEKLNSLMEDIYNLKGNDGKHDSSIVFCPCEYLLDLDEIPNG